MQQTDTRFNVNVLGVKKWDGYIPYAFRDTEPSYLIHVSEKELQLFRKHQHYTKGVPESRCFVMSSQPIPTGVQQIEIVQGAGKPLYYRMCGVPHIEKELVYVLLLKENKYYIGKTTNLEARFAQHLAGDGCAWTKKYPPLEVVETFTNQEDEEDRVVIVYMGKHGMSSFT